MKVSCYLRVTAEKSGYRSDIADPYYFKARDLKVSKTKPDTGASEIAVKLDLEIPNSLFVKPTLEFKMTTPEEAVTLPPMEAEAQDNLAEILSEQLGQKVRLTVSADSEGLGPQEADRDQG